LSPAAEHETRGENTSLLLFAKSGTAAASSLSTNVVNNNNAKPIGDLGLEAAAAARIKFRRSSVNSLVNQSQPSPHNSQQQQQQQQQQRAILIRREKSVCISNKPERNKYITFGKKNLKIYQNILENWFLMILLPLFKNRKRKILYQLQIDHIIWIKKN
jgi:hypothetical protein